MTNSQPGFVAIYASKQMLKWVCLEPISVLYHDYDRRSVKAYIVSRDDWHRIENYYAERNNVVPESRSKQKPVLMRTPVVEQDYYMFIKPTPERSTK